MADAMVATQVRLSSEDLEKLNKLVIKRMVETGRKYSQSMIVRELIREASERGHAAS